MKQEKYRNNWWRAIVHHCIIRGAAPEKFKKRMKYITLRIAEELHPTSCAFEFDRRKKQRESRYLDVHLNLNQYSSWPISICILYTAII